MKAAQVLSRRRLRLCLAIVIGVFGVFGIRLFQIQGLDATAYAAMALQAGTASSTVPAPRGAILDRNGVKLARKIVGAQPFALFKEEIDKLLAETPEKQ